MKNTRKIHLGLLAICACLPLSAQVQEVCVGESVTLRAAAEGEGYRYKWNGDGPTNRSITVDVTAEDTVVYTCVVTKGADANRGNLLTQGGFEFPPSNPILNEVNELGDMISYNYLNFDRGGKDIGQGCTTTARNANDVKPQYFSQLPPHSGEWLLVCDGSSDANAQVWSARDLKLNGGEVYEFSCWVANIDKEYAKHGASSLPKLKFVIERGGAKETLLEFTAPVQTGVWEQKTVLYTPTADMSCNIYIVNYTTYYEGNDFALDDIQFRSTKQDAVDTVAVETFTVVGKNCTVPDCRADLVYAKWSDVIFCSNAGGEFVAYQWYKDSVAIEGAVKQYYYNPTEGLAGASYMVKAVKKSGEAVYSCSMDYSAIPRSAEVSAAGQVSVAVHGRTVTVEQPCERPMRIRLVNMVGVTVWQGAANASAYTFEADAAGGTYVLSVQTDDGCRNEKIVLSR